MRLERLGVSSIDDFVATALVLINVSIVYSSILRLLRLSINNSIFTYFAHSF